MTKLELYTQLKRAEELLNKATKSEHTAEAKGIIENIAKLVETNIYIENCQSTETLSVCKAAFKILEHAEKYSDYKDILGKAYRSEKYLDICDSFRMVRFNIATAPTLREHPAGYDRYPDVSRLIPREGYDNEVDLPNVGELTAHIKIQKAKMKAKGVKRKIVYAFDVNDTEVLFDAELLLTMLQCLPNSKAFLANERPEYKCMLFKAETGTGLLFPLRKELL